MLPGGVPGRDLTENGAAPSACGHSGFRGGGALRVTLTPSSNRRQNYSVNIRLSLHGSLNPSATPTRRACSKFKCTPKT